MVAIRDSRRKGTVEKKSDPIPRKNGISAHFALITFLKGMIGPGCFSLPLAFKDAGLWTAFVMVFAIGSLCTICMLKLVRCSQYLSSKNSKITSLDYGQLAEESVRNGFGPIRKFYPFARLFVNACLIALQIGICSIYFLFVCEHVQEVVEYFHSDVHLNNYVYMAICLLPFWVVTMISNVKVLSWVSLVGNVFMISSIILIFVQLLGAKHDWVDLPAITDFSGIVTAAGAIIYSFEGQALVLPLENRMKYGSDMGGWNGVLPTGMSLVTIVYASCGFFGYITYGQAVKGSITLNMPDDVLNLVAKILLMLVILTGFPVQILPMVSTIWPWMDKKLKNTSNWIKFFAHYGFRTSCLIVSVGLAAAVPNLENIIPLVGVSAGMLLALVIPAFIDTNTFLPRLIAKRRTVRAIFICLENAFYCITGVFFLITGLKTNIQNLLSNDQ